MDIRNFQIFLWKQEQQQEVPADAPYGCSQPAISERTNGKQHRYRSTKMMFTQYSNVSLIEGFQGFPDTHTSLHKQCSNSKCANYQLFSIFSV